MDKLITKHSTIMDKYDPDKRIGMIIDEWGTWFDASQEQILDSFISKIRFVMRLLQAYTSIFSISMLIVFKWRILHRRLTYYRQ